jgi:hypothetical protein
MEDSTTVAELLWVEQQRVNRTRIQHEGRKVLQWFLLVLVLTAVTVVAASYLAFQPIRP